MTTAGDDSLQSRLRHEQPFLYPWNLRLRHLHGVSLRNLHLVSSNQRRRNQTITDDDAPYNLVSPAKRALKNDTKPLTQSRSFATLSKAIEEPPASPTPKKAATSYHQDEKPQGRPGKGKLRRRSTLHWGSTSPRMRQSKLEDMVVNRLADAWVSIHHPSSSDPVYVTEVIERSMNPSFAFFDLVNSTPEALRSDQCTIRAWTRSSRTEDFFLLVELDLNFRSLQFIGKSLEHFHHPLPQNCVLLHMSDGIYTSFTDLPADSRPVLPAISDPKDGSRSITASFDQLMQLANLDECIQDALKVRDQIETDINKILSETHLTDDVPIDDSDNEDPDPVQVKAALVSEQRQLRHLTRRRDELKQLLLDRDKALASAQDDESNICNLIDEHTTAIKELETRLERLRDDSTGQIRRICTDILAIFPIEPIKNRPLQFTIRGLPLPNSVFDDTNRDEIAAALGFTAQIVHQLSLYLSSPLPYPIEPYGSASFINDPISISLTQRRFPLHPTNVPYKFEYAVFLLNKDLEVLMSKAGLRVLDIRHTLPNLKYLLYVLTAGKGEMPARKAGGVRALSSGGGRWTPVMSREASEESIRRR